MMVEKKRALFAGANGLTGSFLLKELLYNGHYDEIEIWVRKSVEKTFLNLREQIIDFDSIDQIPIKQFDHVYCCLGTTIKKAKSKEAFRRVDFEYVLKLAEYAEKAGASKFIVVSSIGANKKSSNFYLRTKGEMEDSIMNLSIPSIFILRPSILFGKREESRIGEIIAQRFMKFIGFIFIGKLKKYKGIEAKAVAKAMLRLAKENMTGKITIESDKIQYLSK